MEVQKVDDISYASFMQEFYQPGIPVVFKNASKVWKAKDLFSPDWFRSHYGERKTEVKGQIYTMREVMDMVETSSANNPAPYPFYLIYPKRFRKYWN